ncbi:hypothetical protein [Pedobacter panaciterrae]|uniref:hypothetical protein n=1 Tax=Pedobacter panaciterrae TaxID=363849 RepID=UPI00259915C7|nr:hypothetical protein [uncultured Pedobacter sp.]
MGLEQIIDSSILDIFPLMPSTGAWPFTMIRIDRNELSDLEMDKPLFAPFQLLVLKRTDFNDKDLLDYAIKSKEYHTILPPFRSNFLENYSSTIGNEKELQEWADKTTSLAIGLVINTALLKGIQFIPIATDLSALDLRMGLVQKNLRSHQLFDAYQIDPSFLV